MTDPTRISDDQHNNAPAPAPAQGEPFGYFRAEPFGWTDCSEDAEGAIALYEHPAHEKHWTENEPVRLPSARTDRVYLAGPMTGIAELNFPAFNQEAERLRAEGLQVLNPADHGIVDGADWADYLRHDIAGLSSCERIHLLRGWTKSKGACLEMTIAKALGMTVTYQVDAEIEHNNAPAVPQGEPVAYIETITGRLCAPLDEHRLKFPMCYEPLCKQGTAPAQEQCNACLGTGRMVRDPDIGTDQECFVCDGSGYEPEQEVGLTEGEIQALGHRIATTYRHDEDGFRRQYAFNIYTLVDFANAIIAALRAKGGK